MIGDGLQDHASKRIEWACSLGVNEEWETTVLVRLLVDATSGSLSTSPVVSSEHSPDEGRHGKRCGYPAAPRT